jgi:hypothetical protein
MVSGKRALRCVPNVLRQWFGRRKGNITVDVREKRILTKKTHVWTWVTILGDLYDEIYIISPNGNKRRIM